MILLQQMHARMPSLRGAPAVPNRSKPSQGAILTLRPPDLAFACIETSRSSRPGPAPSPGYVRSPAMTSQAELLRREARLKGRIRGEILGPCGSRLDRLSPARSCSSKDSLETVSRRCVACGRSNSRRRQACRFNLGTHYRYVAGTRPAGSRFTGGVFLRRPRSPIFRRLPMTMFREPGPLSQHSCAPAFTDPVSQRTRPCSRRFRHARSMKAQEPRPLSTETETAPRKKMMRSRCVCSE